MTGTLQRKGTGQAIGAVTATPAAAPGPAPDEAVAQAGFGGASSPVPYQREMSAAFGVDFSGVEAHQDETAAAACDQLGAQAYAMGSQVAFAGAPTREVVAHELAHVVQQSGGREGVARKGVDGADAGGDLESNADRAAEQVAAGGAVTVPLLPAGEQISRLATVGSVTYTRNPRTPADLRRLMPGTFLGPFSIAVHSRTPAEWNTFFQSGAANDGDDGMHDLYGFMLLALGQRPAVEVEEYDRPFPLPNSDAPYSRYDLSGRAPTEEQAVDCMAGMLRAGTHLDWSWGPARSLAGEFTARFHPLALQRFTGSGREMQRGHVEAVAGVAAETRGSGVSEAIIGSGLGTACGAATDIVRDGDSPEAVARRPQKITLMRNGALSLRGALDEIEAHERFEAALAQGAFNAAVAMVAVAFPPLLTVAPEAAAAATAFGTMAAPVATRASLVPEVAAAGMTEMAQVWFAAVTGGNSVAQRRDLKDRFRARIGAYARQRSFDALATETLINTFDNALDY